MECHSDPPSLEPDALIEVSNRLFKRFTAALAQGHQQVGVPIAAPPEDIRRIERCVAEMLDRIRLEAVIETTRQGIVLRRKTDAD